MMIGKKDKKVLLSFSFVYVIVESLSSWFGTISNVIES